MYITVSYAQSIDGRIATKTGDSQWISGEETLQLAQTLRRDNDAIVIGIGTLLKDDPLLTCRIQDNADPVRVILDSTLRIPMQSQIVRTAGVVETVVFYAGDYNEKVDQLSAASVECIRVGRTEEGLDIDSVLESLESKTIKKVFVEGGSGVITSFIRERKVDRLTCVIAPIIIGNGISAVQDLGVERLSSAQTLIAQSLTQHGNDIVWDLEFA